MEQRTVAVPGARLHVERHGRGEPLLWVTGFAISAQVFEPLLPLYGEHFDCITYDNRGAGRSSVPLLPTSMPQLAADAVRVMDALGLPAAHVHGVSMGGMVATEMALRFPDRVLGLVLQGTTAGGPRPVPPELQGAAALAAQRVPLSREQRRRVAAETIFSAAYLRAHPAEAAAHLQRLGADRAGARGALLHLLASATHDAVARLPQVQAPALVLHGGDDRLLPTANARLLAAGIPRAELAVVPGAGHVPMLERPREVLDLVLHWLERVGPVRPGRPLEGLRAAVEPVTRIAGLPVGVARSTRSMLTATARMAVGLPPNR